MGGGLALAVAGLSKDVSALLADLAALVATAPVGGGPGEVAVESSTLDRAHLEVGDRTRAVIGDEELLPRGRGRRGPAARSRRA